MPRVIVDRPLRWNKKDYPPGVAVDMPDEVLDSLPDGVVHQMTPDTPVVLMQPPSEPETRTEEELAAIGERMQDIRAAAAPPPAAISKPFMPVVRPIQTPTG